MLKINKKIEYALIVIKFIADKDAQGELTTTREICDHFNTPFDTTAKVMQTMNSKNILESVKGIKGGYSLSCDLSKLSYYDLALIIEDKKASDDYCENSKKPCELIDTCNIISPLNNFKNNINNYLKKVSLHELLWSEI